MTRVSLTVPAHTTRSFYAHDVVVSSVGKLLAEGRYCLGAPSSPDPMVTFSNAPVEVGP